MEDAAPPPHLRTSTPLRPALAKRVSWAGLRRGAAQRLCCRNWPERPGRARPRPRGWKQRGLGAGEEAELSGDPALGWLGLCRRGEGRASGTQMWEALEFCGRKPSALGLACARSAIYCAGAARAGLRALRRGAVGWIGAGPLVRLAGGRAGLRRPGRLGRQAQKMGPPRS